MPQILKWNVPVDDQFHPIGAGPVRHVACQHEPNTVQVWTEETSTSCIVRGARVYATGQPIPADIEHVGSALAGPLAWHVYATPTKETP